MSMKRALIVSLLWFAAMMSPGLSAAEDENCYLAATRIAPATGTSADLLIALISVESGGYPWVLNVDGNPAYYLSKGDAVIAAQHHIANGRNVDVGCTQISWKWHGRNFRHVSELIDVENNVRYGSAYLAGLEAETGSWSEAVGKFHSGRKSRQIRYRCRVAAVLAARLGQTLTECD